MLRPLRFIFPCMGLLLLAWVAARAVMDPLLCWDPWAYHLPFAILLWDIGGAGTTNFEASVYHMLPMGVIAEWFQGLFWRMFGSPNFVSLINIIPLYASFYFAWRWFRVSWILLALLSLSMPMIAIHATSGYIDLMIGGLIFNAVLAGLQLIKCQESTFKHYCGPLILMFISLVIAANSKYTALLPVAGILTWTALKILFTDWRLRKGLVVFILVLCGAASAAHIIHNYRTYGNPVTPFGLDLPGGIHFDGSFPSKPHEPASYLNGLPMRNGWQFLTSVTEIDWYIQRPNRIFYSEAAQAGDYRGESRRTGGLFGPLVLAELVWIGLGTILLRRIRDRHMNAQLVNALQYFVLLTAVYMIQPNTDELRYSLSWPLTLNFVSTLFVAALIPRSGWRYAGIHLLMGAVLVSIQLYAPLQRRLFSLSFINYYPEAVRKHLNSEILAGLEANKACLVAPADQPYQYDYFGACYYSIIAYSAAFTGGNYVTHFKTCERPAEEK